VSQQYILSNLTLCVACEKDSIKPAHVSSSLMSGNHYT